MLVLAAVAYDDLLAHAREDAPREACGVLVGYRETTETGERELHAERARRVANVADAPRVEYEMEPVEQMRAFEAAEAGGQAVVGFYHSHPAGPARMSERDRRDAAWPDYAYLLVSLAGRPPFVGAWTWTGDDFERESVAVRN